MAVGEAARPSRLGRYELITRIGQGGMAEVQLALQRGPAGFEKLVVVKLVHDNLASQKAFVDMLLDEARVAALVKHPNVVDIYDLGQADGRFFIAMEYLEGEPLLAVLRAGRDGKRLDPLSTGRLIADTADGLDAAHELRSMAGERLELVHHDISLGNIVVLYNGQVKLVDFGVAKATTAAGNQSKVQGKFSYMAPEKLTGAAGDRRSDIFSLGCVMWEALTLKRLFRGGNDADTMKQVLELAIQPPSKVNSEVPAAFDAIVMRALDRAPEKRHRTAKELAVEIEELLRRRGYGAKNDRIAKYMQDTFKGHIDARQKLVHEVVSKGSASAEVLDAAFSDPVLASGSPVPAMPGSEFSIKHSAVAPASASWAEADADAEAEIDRPTEISAPPVFDEDSKVDAKPLSPPSPPSLPARRTPAHSPRPPLPPPPRPAVRAVPLPVAVIPPLATAPLPARAITATEIDAEPIVDGPAPSSAVEAPAPDAATTTADPPVPSGLGAGIGERVKAILADKTKRRYVAAGAGALLLVVIIVAAAGGGGDHKAPVDERVASSAGDVEQPGEDEQPSDVEQPGADDKPEATEQPVEVEPPADTERPIEATKPDDTATAGNDDGGAESRPSNATHRGDSSKSEHRRTKHEERRRTAVEDRRPRASEDSPPAVDVEAAVQQSLMAFVKGDSKGALAMLQKAKSAKPGYAPTYRVLGRVYQKLGDKGSAKRAFQRYLALSPAASDADQVREEIKKL